MNKTFPAAPALHGCQPAAVGALRLDRAYGGQVKKNERGRWCADRLLNARSMRKALEIRSQLREHLLSLKVSPVP